MRGFFRFFPVTAVLAALAVIIAAPPAGGTPDRDSNSPTYTMNKRTYLWILPNFWMGGEETYGYFRIENTLSHAISLYMHCWTAEGTVPGMTGRYTLGPRQVKVVDSRQYKSGGKRQGAVRVRCTIKSNSLATVQYLTRDARPRNIGDFLNTVRPEVS